jgi:hypothetical protein
MFQLLKGIYRNISAVSQCLPRYEFRITSITVTFKLKTNISIQEATMNGMLFNFICVYAVKTEAGE